MYCDGVVRLRNEESGVPCRGKNMVLVIQYGKLRMGKGILKYMNKKYKIGRES